ncbi:sperm acrosome membrane-associated protein 6 isoform X1 [Phacochoerus africanus]|uniref:sperm acrosome membrane-associated protein 6 isoform X1 n=1 Tax=Phacochoerus africanus TaxID=41426 RepID=UPI001FD99ED1|nr:sperm acrosome membrane-associated protein 6 isoform X1 [Phacochoerus africanus]XP_047646312.1 sperm acrosome membrane-associated protein 6 isoform X1 [Phacochoerus africanus]
MALLVPASTVSSALVALSVFGASAWACLLCFTSYNERLQICQIFDGLERPALGECEEAFAEAFKGLLDTEIREETPPSSSTPPGLCGGRDQRGLERRRGSETQDTGDVVLGGSASPSSCLPPPDYDERSHLHDAFTQMTHSLQEVAAAQGSFRVAFPLAARKMRKVISQLKEVPACVPPCGLQEVARRFHCRGCYSTVCDLPLDCPVQDVTVTRGHQAMFSCTVNFQLPKEEITYSWKFAGAPDSGRVLLPRHSAGRRIPGAHPAGAAQAPRDLLLRDHTRPAPPGAALLLS